MSVFTSVDFQSELRHLAGKFERKRTAPKPSFKKSVQAWRMIRLLIASETCVDFKRELLVHEITKIICMDTSAKCGINVSMFELLYSTASLRETLGKIPTNIDMTNFLEDVPIPIKLEERPITQKMHRLIQIST